MLGFRALVQLGPGWTVVGALLPSLSSGPPRIHSDLADQLAAAMLAQHATAWDRAAEVHVLSDHQAALDTAVHLQSTTCKSLIT